MRVRYGWDSRYPDPKYWDVRTPLHTGMPIFFHLYQNLNDKKLRVFLKRIRGRVLDAGCGEGRFMAYADVGIDFSKGMLMRARRSYGGKSFVRASILHLPFRDTIFSASFTIDVVLHVQIEERRDVLEELKRVSEFSYNFVAENRTVIPFILESFRRIRVRTLWRAIPYFAVVFAFPIDRLRKLQIESDSRVLKRLTT